MYQIWQLPKDGVGCLIENPEKSNKRDLRKAGLEMKLQIETDDQVEAQQKFIEWRRKQCPDATVEKADLKRLWVGRDVS